MLAEKMHQTGPILIVDDEQFFQDLLSGILREQGYEVHVAGSGEEALRVCENGRYKVVVMDLVLPDILGTKVLIRMREKDPDIAVVMVTAYASMESAIEALKAGAYDYIKKPIVREDLIHSVNRAIERQHLSIQNQELNRQLEARLEEMKSMSREKEEVFRILDEGLIIMGADGRIYDLNPRAANLLGPENAPLAGTLFSQTGFPLPDGFLAEVQKEDGHPIRATVEYTDPQGEGHEIELVGLALSRGNSPPRLLLGFRDLTSIRDLQKTREEFLAIVSHDLRSPLTSLKGFIEILLNEDYESEEKLKEYLGILDSEADRMIALIEELLDLGRLESGRMKLRRETLSLPELVTYAMRSMEGLSGRKGVLLEMDLVHGVILVHADRGRMLQVLINLLSNAIRFSPEGGKVRTTLREKDGFAFIEVCDDGPGVPAEERELIFEKYHRAERDGGERGKGSGLGLAIARKIIELHGGRIALADKEEGRGCCFIIRMAAGKAGDK